MAYNHKKPGTQWYGYTSWNKWTKISSESLIFTGKSWVSIGINWDSIVTFSGICLRCSPCLFPLKTSRMSPGDPFAQDLNGKWFANAWRSLCFGQNRQRKQWFKQGLLNVPFWVHKQWFKLLKHVKASWSSCSWWLIANLFKGYSYVAHVWTKPHGKSEGEPQPQATWLLLEVQILSQLSQNMQLLLQEMVKNLRSWPRKYLGKSW